MVSIKGLVIRTTPIVPDMKIGAYSQAEVRLTGADEVSFLPVFCLQPCGPRASR